MDLVVYAPGSSSPAYVDVSIVTALSQDALASGAANHDGKAAEIAAKGKRKDYPLISVTPFIIEDHGRFGEDAVKFLRSVAPSEPRLRSKAIRDLYQRLGALLQRRAADAVLSAITVQRRPPAAADTVVVAARLSSEARVSPPAAVDIRLASVSSESMQLG